METTTFITLDYNEFEALVTKHTGKPFCSVSTFEWNNCSSYDCEGVTNKPDPTKWKKSCTAEWIQDQYDGEVEEGRECAMGETVYGGPWQVLLWLCHSGHIPEGNYLIKVFW